MGATRNKNAGIGGTLVSVLIDGQPGSSAKAFNAKVKSHGGGLMFPKIVRRGRGSAGAPKIRLGDPDGEGTISGEYQLTGYPSPDKPKYASGTLIYVMQSDEKGRAIDKVEFPVFFTGLSWSLVEAKQEFWSFTGKWELAGNPVWTWKGTQVTVNAPAANDQETYEGLAKTYDAQGLLTGAVQRIDCEGIADSDAAEATKLAALYAAAVTPPQANLKVVSIGLARGDSYGIQVYITWGLQDSKDQVETPQNVFLQDANSLADNRTLAQMYNTGAPPAPPAPPAGLKLRPFTDTKLNDQKSVRSWTFARTDTADDVINPETTTDTDPFVLGSAASSAVLFNPAAPPADPAPPTGLKLRFKRDLKLNDAVSRRRYEFNLKSTADDVLNPQTTTDTDPFVIGSSASSAVLFNPGSPPSDPTPPSGLKLRRKRDVKLTDATSNRRYEFARRSTVDDVVQPRSRSSRSARSPWLDSVPALIASSTTDAVEATSQWSGFQSTVGALGLEVTTVDDNNKLLVLEYINPGIMVEGSTRGGGRMVDARINAGNLQLYVLENWAETGGFRQITFSRQWLITKPVRRFIIVRTITGTTIPEQNPSTINGVAMPLIGQVNSASFLGLSAGTCVYEGPSYSTNIALSGTLPFFMAYEFFADSNGLFTEVPERLFLAPNRISTATATAQAWVNASSLGLGSLIQTPTSFSFASFVS